MKSGDRMSWKDAWLRNMIEENIQWQYMLCAEVTLFLTCVPLATEVENDERNTERNKKGKKNQKGK